MPACLRPRDEGGRFARYSWLRDAIDFDYGATDMEFDAEPGVEVKTGSAIGVDDLFPYLTDGLDDELAAELDWASYFEAGADGSHTNESFGLDGSAWPVPEWPGGATQDPLGG